METNWKILEISQDGDIVLTKVQYTFDVDVIEIDVIHFQPKSADDIVIGITNRSVSERRDRYGIYFDGIIYHQEEIISE